MIGYLEGGADVNGGCFTSLLPWCMCVAMFWIRVVVQQRILQGVTILKPVWQRACGGSHSLFPILIPI